MAEKKTPVKRNYSSNPKPEARALVKVQKANEEALSSGRQPVYDPSVHPKLVYEYCLLGLSLNRAAKLMNIHGATLHTWKARFPEFAQAILEGTEGADAAVAKALFSRATGYSHADTHITAYQGEVIETPITKHYPPDVAAATFWLKNRAQTAWKDKQEVDNISSDGSMTPQTIQRVIVRPGEAAPPAPEEGDEEE